MSAPALAVFVDGLGYEAAVEHDAFTWMDFRVPMTPGVGYSVNIQTELFAGAMPDAAGYFCDWEYAPRSASRWTSLMWSALGKAVDRSRRLEGSAHRLANRAGLDTMHIPFKHLPDFRRVGRYFPDIPGTPLLERSVVVSWTDARRPYGHRDDVVHERALLELTTSHAPVIATYVDIDAIGHRYGPSSPEFRDALTRLDARLRELSGALALANPAAPMLVFSDHGQADVRGSVALRAPDELSSGIRAMFLDSTIVRLWLRSHAFAQPARSWLRSVTHVFDERERRAFGIANPRFGDLVAVAPEGHVFVPNYHSGDHVPRGMHGYHPSARSQWAMIGARGLSTGGQGRPMSTLDVHHLLLRVCR